MTLLALDLFGTLVFAISGAFRAVKYELDILGVTVLAIATGVGGGIIRDLILGQTPPAFFQNESYFFICVVGALLVFFWAPKIAKGWDYVLIADAIGLGGVRCYRSLQGPAVRRRACWHCHDGNANSSWRRRYSRCAGE